MALDVTTSGQGKGYKITGVFVDVPVEEAVRRAEHREKNSKNPANRGRHVPEEFIRKGHEKAARNFFNLKDNFDEITLYDTGNGEPKLIYAKIGNEEKIHDAEKYESYQAKAGLRQEGDQLSVPPLRRGGGGGAIQGHPSPEAGPQPSGGVLSPDAGVQQEAPQQEESPQNLTVPRSQITTRTSEMQPRKGPGKLGTQPGQVKAIAASMRQGGFDPGKAITVMKEGDSYVVAGRPPPSRGSGRLMDDWAAYLNGEHEMIGVWENRRAGHSLLGAVAGGRLHCVPVPADGDFTFPPPAPGPLG